MDLPTLQDTREGDLNTSYKIVSSIERIEKQDVTMMSEEYR